MTEPPEVELRPPPGGLPPGLAVAGGAAGRPLVARRLRRRCRRGAVRAQRRRHRPHSGVPRGVRRHSLRLVQVYRFDDEPEYVAELAEVCAVPSGALSVDYLVGEPSARGRGLGAGLIAAGVARGFADHPDAHDVLVPVAAANVASWRHSGGGCGVVRRGRADAGQPRRPAGPRGPQVRPAGLEGSSSPAALILSHGH